MIFKYMVSGRVQNAFILRGHYNAFGNYIELLVNDNELNFVKSKLLDVKVEQLNEQENSSTPLLKSEKNEKPKEETTNELQTKPNGGKNKNKYKTRV